MLNTVTHRLPGLILTDMEFRVPLDHARPSGEQITVFARGATAASKEGMDLPWLVFFQGGPGFPAPRPEGNSGWLKRALQDYRVLLLDGRGTGRSSPVTAQTLARYASPQDQAEYLVHFRADSIVQDAELIRRELVGKDGRWSVLGQSFGGFCVTHYLSAAPHGLKEALITGGLPPLDRPVDDIYQATYPSVLRKNRLYYERYPDDAARARAIVDYLATHEVRLPSGGRLTPRRFQQLGIDFGMSYGFEVVHYLLEEGFVDVQTTDGQHEQGLSYPFLRAFENRHAFDTNPIYALLHEAEYCQGEASRWSAERVQAEFPEFDLAPGKPVLFTGEMVYPWMFEDYDQLRPLRRAADRLAEYTDWPRLYDSAKLQANTVPCAAAIYYDDMYVARAYSEETARMIRGLRAWVTNEYEHNGIRADGERVLDRLLRMVHGEI
jgi:pimeloyl-ACP methyl ester carboxylesterase